MLRRFQAQLLIVSSAVLVLLALPVVAQQDDGLVFIYEQPVGGVYSQGWHAQPLGSRGFRDKRFYVVGDGKLSDFHGVLSVNCETPSLSTWLTTGAFAGNDSVPQETIAGIRRLACD